MLITDNGITDLITNILSGSTAVLVSGSLGGGTAQRGIRSLCTRWFEGILNGS